MTYAIQTVGICARLLSTQGIASVFNSALQGVRNDAQDRQSESKYRKQYGVYGGNSAMDAVVQVQKVDDPTVHVWILP